MLNVAPEVCRNSKSGRATGFDPPPVKCIRATVRPALPSRLKGKREAKAGHARNRLLRHD